MPEEGEFDEVLAGVGGRRVAWHDVPLAVRRSVEGRAGSAVVGVEGQEGGFSPALAARLRLADGRRAFVKAIGPHAGAPGGQDLYRQEATVTAALPAGVPVPRLLDSWEMAGWVVLLLEDVADGATPAIPWRNAELRRILDAVAELAELLTPSPLDLRPARHALGGAGGWRELAVVPAALDRLEGLDPWISAHLDRLVALEEGWPEATRGETLLHTDLRADNVLVTPHRVVFVDWPHASVGAPWLDLVFLLVSVAMQGGPEPEELFGPHPSAAGCDAGLLAAVLAAFTGFMFRGAVRPAPPGLPRLPAFQRAQGEAALRWLRRLG